MYILYIIYKKLVEYESSFSTLYLDEYVWGKTFSVMSSGFASTYVELCNHNLKEKYVLKSYIK